MLMMPLRSIQSSDRRQNTKAFCSCAEDPEYNRIGKKLPCSCGEDKNVHEWAWDEATLTTATRLSSEDREVQFHPSYSSGTAAIRGNMPCVRGNNYFWEIKMLTPLYGTDVMIGVGTEKVDLQKSPYVFCSLLGSDEESWGYSYHGSIHHKGEKEPYGLPFGHGSIIGVHLDMWRGTLQFYLNRKPLGVAFKSLGGRTLYPMICSTAAKSAMRVIYSASAPSSLQLMCFQSLSSYPSLIQELRTVPFLRSQVDREYWWLIPSEGRDHKGDEGGGKKNISVKGQVPFDNISDDSDFTVDNSSDDGDSDEGSTEEFTLLSRKTIKLMKQVEKLFFRTSSVKRKTDYMETQEASEGDAASTSALSPSSSSKKLCYDRIF